jgi:hypothetical protein
MESFTDWVKQHKTALFGVGVAALLVAVVVTLVLQPFGRVGVEPAYAHDAFTMSATQADGIGVSADSGYILESKHDIDAKTVKDKLSVNIDKGMTVEQVSDRRVRVAFDEPLDTKEIVQFKLESDESAIEGVEPRPYAWAFQVKSPYRVETSIPGDEATGVPLDTGIEVRFSHETSVEDFQQQFSITPQVDGRFEKHRDTVVFVPENRLKPATEYTVEIGANLTPEDSTEMLGENRRIVFETSLEGQRRTANFNVSGRFLNYSTDQNPAIPYQYYYPGSYGEELDLEPQVTVYGLSDYEEYRNAARKARDISWRDYPNIDNVADTSQLNEVASFTGTVGSINGRDYIGFPEGNAIQPGYYLVDVELEGQRDWALVSISDVAVYTSLASNKTLVWANDASNGQPIEGADVHFIGANTSFATDASGVAELPNDEAAGLLEVRTADDGLIVPVWVGVERLQKGENVPGRNFWGHIYSDRNTFRPEDTVRVFGFLKHRQQNTSPDVVTVQLTRSSYCFSCDEVVYTDTRVQLTENGTYTTTLNPPKLPPGNYAVEVVHQGEVVDRTSVVVEEYIKPGYQIDVSTEQDAVMAGDPVNVDIQASFFEGTPVKNLAVLVSGRDEEKEVVLDANGRGQVEMQTEYNDNNNYYPQSHVFRVTPVRAEEGEIVGRSSVLVHGPKVAFSADAQQDNGTVTVDVTARTVEPIDSTVLEEYAPNVRPGQVIEGEVRRVSYERTQTGTSYDFINKVVVPEYEYERIEETVDVFSLTTDEDGGAQYTFPTNVEEATYLVDLSATDELGRTYERTLYVYEGAEGMYGSERLTFKDADGGVSNEYDTGERVALSVFRGNQPIEETEEDRFLYYQAQQGIQERQIAEEGQYVFEFNEDDVPNTHVFGVRFTGVGYEEITGSWYWRGSAYNATYDYQNSDLNIDISLSEERYVPGDEARVNVRVTNQAGQPVSTDVNVSVVDEAYFAIYEDASDPLPSLFRNLNSGVYETEASHREFAAELSGGAEMGGMSDRGRDDFEDTAAFKTVTTDADGTAETTFQLPDNITAWRVTAQAIEHDDLKAGIARETFDVGLPYFITPVLRNSYLVDDDPTIQVRSAGREIDTGMRVEYTLNIQNHDYNETVTAGVGESARFELPDLAPGTYDLTFTGRVGDMTDRATHRVRIVESRLIEPVMSTTVVSDGDEAIDKNSTGWTELVFMDANKGRFFDDVNRLSYNYGDRLDQVLAEYKAKDLLKQHFDVERPDTKFTFSAYQSGLASLLPYGDTDLELSARAALLDDNLINEQELALGFMVRLGEEREMGQLSLGQAAMLQGALAATGEPNLIALQQLSQNADLDLDGRLWVATGLYFAGDVERARGMFREMMQQAQSNEPGQWNVPGENVEERAKRTSLAAILAAGMAEVEYRDGLYNYMVEESHGEVLIDLEQAVYLQELLKTLKEPPVSFTYFHDGERKQKTLEAGREHVMMLQPAEVDALDIGVERGDVMVVSSYNKSVTELSEPTGDGQLQRKINEAENPDGRIEAGELVRVELDWEPPADTAKSVFTITDVMPSSFVPLRDWGKIRDLRNRDRCSRGYVTGHFEQRINMNVYDASDVPGCENRVIYYARTTNPGRYTAEPAILREVGETQLEAVTEEVYVEVVE